ncbi:MAG: hypothetical protein IT537_05205 [Hyphomicrobiales bacterium]|nr:hypothetical protein [Hyphomicrobiales bacterium]
MPAALATRPRDATLRSARRLRLVPLVIAASAMVAGLWGGLWRLGLALPHPDWAPAEMHAALMICGFLGTLISLERAVALGSPWGYAAPVVSAAGALAIYAGLPRIAIAAFLFAGILLWLLSVQLAMRQLALFTVVLAVAPACWAIGTLEWSLRMPSAAVTGWWLAFLILTIAAERLELSRLVQISRTSQVTFSFAILMLLVGCVRDELATGHAPLTALGLIACAAWLLHHDVARRTVRMTGQARFSAWAILMGHVWLAAAGLLLLVVPPAAAPFSYDAAVHAVTLGFVLSMIFGHAPIILPAVTGARITFSEWAYLPLALLHLSVVARIAGDVLGLIELRIASGLVTVLALVSYVAALAIPSARRRRPR